MMRSLLVVMVLGRVAAGATYHVAVTGDDTGAGSAGDPFRTIGRCAAVAQPGDTCQVHAGTYRETVTASTSGTAAAHIRFEAAPGDCVTVSGTSPVTLSSGWSAVGGNVYVASTTDTITQLFEDDVALVEARWPNADAADLVHAPWARAGAGTDANGLVATGAPAGDWTGGVVLMLPGQAWASDTRVIAAYDPATQRVMFDSAVASEAGPPAAGMRYVLFGARPGLDAPGEWFLDRAAHQLYVYGDPAGHVLEAKQRTWAFVITGDYIDIVGFTTLGSTIELSNADHCTVDGVIGRYVTSMRATTDLAIPTEMPTLIGNFNTWKNSVIADAAAGGLYLRGSDNVVENNIFHDIDLMATNEAAIDLNAVGSQNLRNLISFNTVTRAGRAGINVMGANQSRVLFNRVDDVNTQTSDQGAIYTWGTDGANTEIAFNEISHAGTMLSAGIYIDDNSKNFVIHHNYLHDIHGRGIQIKDINAVFSNTLRGISGPPLYVTARPDGMWGAVDQALVADNVSDGATDVSFAVHLATQTDYSDYQIGILATDAWQHVTLPFSTFTQPVYGNVIPFDLTQAQSLRFWTEAVGDFDIQLRNVQLEGPDPKIVSSFASSLSSSFGTTWYMFGAQGSTLTAAVVDADPTCAFKAADLSGTNRILGNQGFGLSLASNNAAVDLSGYTGISFDVRARSRVWVESDAPVMHAPIQTRNSACPDDTSGAATTTCAIGQGIAIPPYTSGMPDLGAFPSGQTPWVAGAQLVEPPPGTCTPPADVTTPLSPAQPYPATPVTIPSTPAFVGFDQTCAAPGMDAGADAAVADAGPGRPDAGTQPGGGESGGGDGCCDSGRHGIGGTAALVLVVLVLAGHRRRA